MSSEHYRNPYRGEGLPAVCGSSPRVLILGSFPSVMSLERQEYYGNPHNQFWRIMEAVLGIGADLPYSRRVEEMKRRHIALWDVASECLREGSSDSTIRDVVRNDIAGFVGENPCVRAIFLNGRTGAGKIFSRFFKDFAADFPETAVLIMPSTSPANAAVSLAEKIECWSAVKGYLD
ncbi:MAG: DNA-deoxyinosine glycosylase [Methanomicrobium sp.]|nr:DNA-deoxyinosine glycosylase [Methanomicrobium sp.]